MTLIQTQGLSVSFGGTPVLRDVSLRIEPGEIITIVGPNGSGKSTLLRSLIGAERHFEGHITRKPGLKIGYVPQKLQIDHTLPLTVRRFLDLPQAVPDSEANRLLTWAGAAELASQQMAGLSGGQMQRVLLARALKESPDLMVLDEPTQGLDQPGAAAFYRQIEAVRSDLGCAILMVSHDLHVVMAASDRVICLNGHICCQGAPAQVVQAEEYRALFGTGTKGALALYRHEHDHHHHQHQHHHGHG